MQKTKKSLLVLSVVLSSLSAFAANNYCIALRGNGQLMPSHFGALAKTVETFGVPQGMAGGSSAGISTFLMESILQNPLVKNETDSEKQKAYAAFLWKSLEGIFVLMSQEPEWKSLAQFATDAQQIKQVSDLLNANASLDPATLMMTLNKYPQIQNSILDLQKSGVFNGPAVRSFLKESAAYPTNPTAEQQMRVAAAYAQVRRSSAVFGTFDAQHDQDLFLRPGLVDFHALALLYGRLGDFLALNTASAKTTHAFKSWLRNCGETSIGKMWDDITQEHPECVTSLAQLKQTYFDQVAKNSKYRSRISHVIGRDFPAFVTTSAITGDSAKNFVAAKDAYDRSLGQVNTLPVVSGNDVMFGYWGNAQALAKISQTFQAPNNDSASIDKTKRFKSLGEDTWENILSFSPAEPGLSAVQPYTILTSQEQVISAGGWSDLHPVLVLKASGCEQVVYVSRRGGESDFVAGVGKRLVGFDLMGWNLFDPIADNATYTGVSNRGSDYLREKNLPIDPQWQKMLDVKFPRSSFNYSLLQANAVVCTNWTVFDVQTQLQQMVADGYQAPIYLSNKLPIETVGSFNKIDNNATTFDEQYTGCVPVQ